MTTIGNRIVAASVALKPLGLTLHASRDEFLITRGDSTDNPVLRATAIERVEEFIADHRPAGAAGPGKPVEPLRYAPGATAKLAPESGFFRVGDEVLGTAELRDRGFARESNTSFDSDWVQANCFQVRGLIRRGDAQRFTGTELRDLVMKFFADHGVEVDRPDQLEAFCFNYDPGIDLDKAREQSAADMAAVRDHIRTVEGSPQPPGLLAPVEQHRAPRVGDDVH